MPRLRPPAPTRIASPNSSPTGVAPSAQCSGAAKCTASFSANCACNSAHNAAGSGTQGACTKANPAGRTMVKLRINSSLLSRRSNGTKITPIRKHAYSRKTCSVVSGSKLAKKSPLPKPRLSRTIAKARVIRSNSAHETERPRSESISATVAGFSRAHFSTAP